MVLNESDVLSHLQGEIRYKIEELNGIEALNQGSIVVLNTLKKFDSYIIIEEVSYKEKNNEKTFFFKIKNSNEVQNKFKAVLSLCENSLDINFFEINNEEK